MNDEGDVCIIVYVNKVEFKGNLIQRVFNIFLPSAASNLLVYNHRENAMGSLFRGLNEPGIMDKRSKGIS